MSAGDLLGKQFREAAIGWLLNAQQILINEKGERRHGVTEDPNGQLRWFRGNFDARK